MVAGAAVVARLAPNVGHLGADVKRWNRLPVAWLANLAKFPLIFSCDSRRALLVGAPPQQGSAFFGHSAERQ